MSRTNSAPERTHGAQAGGGVRPGGYTIVELLVTTGIMTALAGLLFPAVQGAREAARLAACRNNVRQVAQAVLQHESAIGHLPSGGWGSSWLASADRGSDAAQPGGWTYGILPYIEATTVHDAIVNTTAATSAGDYAALAAMEVPSFACPSRRVAAPRRLADDARYRTPFDSALAIPSGVVTDYAANGGSTATCPPIDLLRKAAAYVDGSTKVTFCHVPGDDPKKQNTQSLSLSATEQGHDAHDADHIGPCFTCDDDMAAVSIDPTSLSQGDQWRRLHPLARLALPDGGIPDLQDGIVHRMSRLPASAIKDGLSNTYLLGEKNVAADRYDPAGPADAGDDRPLVAGYSSSSVRWAYDPPAPDAAGRSQPNVFGSAHRDGWTAAYADGSVTTLGFDIDPALHKALAARADGTIAMRPE